VASEVKRAKQPARSSRPAKWSRSARGRGVSAQRARKLLLALPGVQPALSYGMPAFHVQGRFFARLRDDDTVLVLQLAEIAQRDVLLQVDPDAFFFTDHYRNYPSVLIRLADVEAGMLKDVLREAHVRASAKPARRPARRKRRA
jgi:hypothetical protein